MSGYGPVIESQHGMHRALLVASSYSSMANHLKLLSVPKEPNGTGRPAVR